MTDSTLSGPNALADTIRDELDAIAARLDSGELSREERRPLNKRAHVLKGLLKWCESRAGYREPVQ
jgi:hypothetical protein